MWDAAKMTKYSAGVHTFSGLPADKNVVVQAAKATDASIKLLDPEAELAMRTQGMEANGITGGAFGDERRFQLDGRALPAAGHGAPGPRRVRFVRVRDDAHRGRSDLEERRHEEGRRLRGNRRR